MKKIGFCKICNKKLSKSKYLYCKSCRTKLQWKLGIRKRKEHNFSHCIDCNKELKSYRKIKPRCKKCWYKFNTGKNNKLFNSEKYCKDCGIKIYKYANGKRCVKCNNKYHSGHINGRWIDGRSFEPYSSEWTNELRKSIRKRDNYTCQLCGLKQNKYFKIYHRALDVHHIDRNKKNNTEKNLITVCRKCHSKL